MGLVGISSIMVVVAIAGSCGASSPSSGTLGESKVEPKSGSATATPIEPSIDAGAAADAGTVSCDCAIVCDCSRAPERIEAKNRAMDACLMNGGGCRCPTCPGE